MVKTYTADELKAVLEAHGKWLAGDAEGVRANLSRANLTRADLTGANLSRANLTRADLTGAHLCGAHLCGAHLCGADLTGADLTGADLRRAYLTGANLSRANLTRANLTRADLTRADLTRAYLSDDTTMPNGESWLEYQRDLVPALLTAGGLDIADILQSGCWQCHQWRNCPMHAALGISDANEAPILLRPRVKEFVHLFDARLLDSWPEKFKAFHRSL